MWGMWNIWGSGQVHTWFRWGNLRERDHLEDLRSEDNIKMDLKEVGWGAMDWTDQTQVRHM